ncbi:MAG: DMT family transporter [Oscillospiraceae bacterium]|nr:DMT family transporter [Oscillospiraceae bacterium]
MNERTLKKLSQLLIVVATLIWGSTFFILKDTLEDVSVFFMLAFRFTLATAILALVFFKRWKGIWKKGYFAAGGVMGTLMFLAYTIQNYGLMETTPGKNAFFTAVYCVMVPFLYWIIARIRPNRFHVLAAVLCLGGIGLVSWDGGFSLGRGDALTLLGGLMYALHIVAVAYFSKGKDIFILTVLQFATTALWSWAATLVTHGLPVGGLPAQGWAVLLYLAIAATTLALLFQNVGQKYTDPSSAAVLLSLEAPFGVAFSMIFYQERPTVTMVAGFVLIFLSILCAETKFSFLRHKKSEEAQAVPAGETTNFEKGG